jgi:hypothetical protein
MFAEPARYKAWAEKGEHYESTFSPNDVAKILSAPDGDIGSFYAVSIYLPESESPVS